ncbi:hypothetical protein BH09BAC1_BH09BAC1_09450 [soil metagenome]
MSDLFDRIKKLFSQAEDEQQPATHELISRTEAELAAYEQWKKSKRSQRLLEGFRAKMENRDSGEAELSLDFIDTPRSRGFVLHYEEGLMTGLEMRHLLDYFKEQLLVVGYASYMSDVKNQLKAEVVQTIERHYLKPKFNPHETTEKTAQRFGNITIEYLQENNLPINLKFISNIYSDHKYADARPFKELMEILVLG